MRSKRLRRRIQPVQCRHPRTVDKLRYLELVTRLRQRLRFSKQRNYPLQFRFSRPRFSLNIRVTLGMLIPSSAAISRYFLPAARNARTRS